MEMASFRMHGQRWQARVTRKGYPVEVRSFLNRQDAERWARSIEIEMDRGRFVSPTEAQSKKLGDLIDRYIEEVLPSMKGARDDRIRLSAIKRDPLCRMSAAALTPARLAKYRDERLTKVAAGTVIREMAYLSIVINQARREWGVHIENPIALVRRPPMPRRRDRVLNSEEQERLLEVLRPTGRLSPWMPPLVIVALESAMRRGNSRSVTTGWTCPN
jgi:integrase